MIFGPYAATVIRAHDGDTITVDVKLRAQHGRAKLADRDLGFNVHIRPDGIWLANQSVRLFGCNAPELATDAGKQALAFLLTLVKVGDQVSLISHGWDKYGGRVDGTVKLGDGSDLAYRMIQAGHAVFWDGTGAKPV